MSNNSNLRKAKASKNDEFYTRIEDIEEELRHYKDQFENKTVFLNCDDPEESEFWQFFSLQFDNYKLKRLISTHYDTTKPTYMLEKIRKEDGTVEQNKKTLTQNGDFRSPECVALLDECDIVVTNPPFSLFREYIALLMEHEKKFLVIGSMNAVTYKEIFPLIKENKIWFGYNYVKSFIQPDGTIAKFGNILWYTNLDVKMRHEELILWKEYTPKDFPKYDNYDAIEIRDPKTLRGSVKHIPKDYDGAMGVPITFLENYCPEQFEILDARDFTNQERLKSKNTYLVKDADSTVNGKAKFPRILIRRKTND